MSTKKIILFLMAVTALWSCSKDEVLVNHESPKVFIPSNGLSINTAWYLEEGKYNLNLQVYCSGLTKGASNDITVNYIIDPALITEYNNDISQEFSGKIEVLPPDCYKIESGAVIIPKGQVYGNLPVSVYVNKLIEKGLSLNELKYAIPIRLDKTSSYQIHESPKKVSSLLGVVVNSPNFFFWVNRNGLNTVGIREPYSEKAKKHSYIIKAEGTPVENNYDLNIDIDPSFLKASQTLLPENAYKIESNKVTINKGETTAELPVSIISSNMEFQKEYYLPVRIASASKYQPHPEKNVLLLKVEVKNDYEWSYISKISITDKGSGRNSSYQVNKSPVSVAKDIIMLQMIKNSTIAGYSFNNKYFNLKIIPTDNKNKWGVELIKITNMGAYSSPSSLELNPDKESYYDWDYETFYLYYRFKRSDGSYIEVQEILEAQI